MRKPVLLLLGLLWSMTVTAAGPVHVENVRMWQAPDSLRVVFDISEPVEHSLFMLSDPDRVVVDLADADLAAAIGDLDFADSWLSNIRSAPRNGDDLRVVFDMKHRVHPKSFILKPNDRYGHRLVIDLEGESARVAKKERGGDAIMDLMKRRAPAEGSDDPRDIVVAIDAGHGGEDPGALGAHGTHEKDVVLAIARKLEALVEREPGMRPLMFRDGDYYVALRERVRLAREAKADLFVSIHADAFKNPRARGSSVYALSQRGASSEAARWLAESENSADLVGGVSLNDKDELLASVLLDLSQTAAIEASVDVGTNVLRYMKNVNHLHKKHVEQAGFVVLKSPDVPSILVETAFISNPREERKLRSPAHQRELARSILAGVRTYFSKNPPPGTVLALRRNGDEHVISRGETLTSIAREHRVSLDALRSVNGLHGDTLKVGQTLRIPRATSGS